MKKKTIKQKRDEELDGMVKIYAILFKDNYAYVGSSVAPRNRLDCHIKSSHSLLLKRKLHSTEYQHLIINQALTKEEAYTLESDGIEYFKALGYKMINQSWPEHREGKIFIKSQWFTSDKKYMKN